MDTEAVQTLARNLIRLRSESLVLQTAGQGLVLVSRALRAERRALSREYAKQQDASNRSRIRRTIARRPGTGRLHPRVPRSSMALRAASAASVMAAIRQ